MARTHEQVNELNEEVEGAEIPCAGLPDELSVAGQLLVPRHGDMRGRRIGFVDYVETFNASTGRWEIDLSSGKVDRFERAARQVHSIYGDRRH